jgi:hypothetical protein
MAIQKQVPKVPMARPLTEEAVGQFASLKAGLSAIASWGLSPNDYDKIKPYYNGEAKEAAAQAIVKAMKATYEKPF